MNYVYSPSKLSFYPLLLKDDYEAAGTWPTDGIEVSDEVYNKYSVPPVGQMRGADLGGNPSWEPCTSNQLSLAELQAAACLAVDSAAGAARAKYMTIVAGQEATYQQKAASCRKWIADGKPTTISAAIYPGLNADYEARLRHDAATSLQATVDEILATEALWIEKLDAIELARRAGKIAIAAGTDSAAVDAARDAAWTELAGL